MAYTNKNRKFYIAVTIGGGTGIIPIEKSTDLANAAAYAALNWTEVKHVGNIGESGSKDNIVNYDELGTDVIQKNKGLTNAGDPVVECARSQADYGQIAMRAAGLTHLYYAFKVVDDDMPSGGTNGTTYYNRGLVVGPVRPNGRNEAFNLEMFTLGLVQREIIVDAV